MEHATRAHTALAVPHRLVSHDRLHHPDRISLPHT